MITARSSPNTERWIGWVTLLLVTAKATWEAATGQAFLNCLHFGLMGSPLAISHAGGIVGAAVFFFLIRRRVATAV